MSFKINHPLVLDQNFNIHPKPQIKPTASSPRILVVGGGVTGLISAWVLLDRGYHVTIVAKEWASYTPEKRLTSQIAGALWEYPPAVCGQHTDTISLTNSKRWCMVSYRIWDIIAANPDISAISGVQMRRSVSFFPGPIEENPAQFEKLRELARSGVRGFRRDSSLIQNHNINGTYGMVDAYEHLAPIIDTDISMEWLMSMARSKGAKFITEAIHGDLFSQEDELQARFNVDAIVNATGLAGSELAGDKTCFPIRGALLRVINDGKNFPKVHTALIISAGAAQDNEIVFIVPRNDNILLLGGIAQPNHWNLDLTLESPIITRMRERCEAFLPSLRSARLDPDYPLAQGLRPFRQQNVRVERELRRHAGRRSSRIVHSYGHGGSGWSLAFGCAEDVASLIEDALRDVPAGPMVTYKSSTMSRL